MDGGGGGQTYSKGPKTVWAPSSRGLFPISHNAFFIDIGSCLSTIKFHNNLHLLITVQTQLKSISKRSPSRQAISPPHHQMDKGHLSSSRMHYLATIRFCTAEYGSPKRAMLSSTTQEYSRERRLTFPSVIFTSRNH